MLKITPCRSPNSLRFQTNPRCLNTAPSRVRSNQNWKRSLRVRRLNNSRRHPIKISASTTPVTVRLTAPGREVESINMVYKFGGSSVADASRMKEVADILCSFPEYFPCVVLSAMGNTTNLLIESGRAALKTSAHEIALMPTFLKIYEKHIETAEELEVSSGVQDGCAKLLDDLKQLLTGISMMQELTPRAQDALVSFGERLSTRLFSGFLNAQGVTSVQLDAWDLGFVSDDNFMNADVNLRESIPRIRESLNKLKSEIPVVTGFLARGEQTKAITTLGRGGSDLTATVVGMALNLPEVQVWKDVDGVLTSDPRIVPTAQPLPILTYEEANELAYFGAQILHPRAMKPAMQSKHGMSVRVKNSYNRMAPGTVIQSTRDLSDTFLTSIVIKRGISVVDIVSTSMLGQFGFLARVFQIFKERRISVDVVSTSEISVSISLDVNRYSENENDKEIETLVELFEGWADVSLRKDLSIVSLICNIQRSSEILEKVFKCLREQEINVQMISQGASKTNISLVVANDEVDTAVKAVHRCFFDRPEITTT